MSKLYNLDGVKTQLNRDLEEKRVILDAWKKVTFPTKKDGSPFSNISKNFDGANYHCISAYMQAGENELSVCEWSKTCGYVRDEIRCYEIADSITDAEKIAKKENYLPKQTYLAQVYKYDVEDIKKAITNRIEKLEKDIARLEYDLTVVDDVYNRFKNAYTDAVKQLENDCIKSENGGYSPLKDYVFDTVKKRYPYC